MKNKKLANFDNPKWTYNDLKFYAKKYREILLRKEKEHKRIPIEIKYALRLYQMQHRNSIIYHLKQVQSFLLKRKFL